MRVGSSPDGAVALSHPAFSSPQIFHRETGGRQQRQRKPLDYAGDTMAFAQIPLGKAAAREFDLAGSLAAGDLDDRLMQQCHSKPSNPS